MKINFWQIVGIALIVIGAIGMVWWHNSKPADGSNDTQAMPTTQSAQ